MGDATVATGFPQKRFCHIISGPLPGSGPRMSFRYCIVLFFAASLVAGTPPETHSKNHRSEKTQMQPAPQRIAEIQAALKAHGYDPGTTWEETQGVCRRIADEHRWQTDHAPDARVLILLGLGGPHSDPAVTQMQGGRLDQDQRTEAARQSRSVAQNTLRPATTSGMGRAENPARRAATSKTTIATRLSAATREEAPRKTPAKGEKRKIARKGTRKSKPKPALAAMSRPAAVETSMN